MPIFLLALGAARWFWRRDAIRRRDPIGSAWSKIDGRGLAAQKAHGTDVAEAAYRQALEFARANHREDLEANSLANLGYLAANAGRWSDAAALLHQAYDIRLRDYGPDHEMTVKNAETLAEIAGRQRRWDEVMQLKSSLVDVYKRRGVPEAVADTLRHIGVAARHLGDQDAADARYAEALRILEHTGKTDSKVGAKLLKDWAYLDNERHRYTDGEDRYRQSLVIARGQGDLFQMASTWDNLADLLTAAGRPADGAQASDSWVAACQDPIVLGHWDNANPLWVPALDVHARRLRAAGREGEADAIEARAAKIRSAHPDEVRELEAGLTTSGQ